MTPERRPVPHGNTARHALAVVGVLMLAGCGQGADPGADTPASPPRPAPTEAERIAILTTLPAPYDQADLENGRRAFARCRSCHTLTEGGPNMTGPNLHGVFGRRVGAQPRYNYSNAVKQADFVWDAERLDHWLQNPRSFLPGNKMTFAGLPDAVDRRDVIAYLKVETGYQP